MMNFALFAGKPNIFDQKGKFTVAIIVQMAVI
jgi:hypothetical protein